MRQAINEAIVGALRAGVVRSTTLMVPCPWALPAMRFLTGHPEIPFGIHLTAICESAADRWRPVTPRDRLPSLLNEEGFFCEFARMPELLARMRLEELETEFRAHIEVALDAGLRPTHLDWHSLRISNRPDILEVMFRLAREYGLALRVMGQTWIEKLHRLGLPANDYDILDSYSLGWAGKTATCTRLLRELPEGLSEWAVHPGLLTAETSAAEADDMRIRHADYDFLVSEQAQDVIRQEGIILLDYRPLQAVWQATPIWQGNR
jgi:chitin disaccharide deacetylase